MREAAVDEFVKSFDKVIYPEQVPDLFPVAVYGNWFVVKGGYNKPGNPALIFKSELSCSVNT